VRANRTLFKALVDSSKDASFPAAPRLEEVLMFATNELGGETASKIA
jgi:hypothetical protein